MKIILPTEDYKLKDVDGHEFTVVKTEDQGRKLIRLGSN